MLFEKELEIPEIVQNKMNETYQMLGAVSQPATKRKHRSFRQKKQFLKVAVIAFCFLTITVTASAAANGGFQSLKALFSGDIKLIRSFSSNPETATEKNTFSNLEISIEQITGTDKLTYIVLNIKRTDGKKFNKDKNYMFDTMQLRGETKPNWNSGKNITEDRYEYPGFTIKNDGTDEITMALIYSYTLNVNGHISTLKGEHVTLLLKGLCEETGTGERVVSAGFYQTEFLLDYGNAPQKVIETDIVIRLPKYNTQKEYLPIGTLNQILLTPYYIQYKFTSTEKEDKNSDKTWGQIYIEMKDGTIIGNSNEREWQTHKNTLGGYGDGEWDKETSLWHGNGCILFQSLIDLEDVAAIWFGDTKIQVL